jgi:RNA polymerase sigma-70 factor (ECF subfamily)
VVAATRVVRGADRIARFLVGGHVRVRSGAVLTVDFVSVGGQPGLMIRQDGKIAQVSAFEFEGDQISVIYAVRNPDKLTHLGAVVAGRERRK